MRENTSSKAYDLPIPNSIGNFFEIIEEIVKIEFSESDDFSSTLFFYQPGKHIMALNEIPINNDNENNATVFDVLQSIVDALKPDATVLVFKGSLKADVLSKKKNESTVNIFLTTVSERKTSVVLYERITAEGVSVLGNREVIDDVEDYLTNTFKNDTFND